MTQSLTADERETIITTSDAADVVHIWTAQRKVITALRKKPAFTETGTGYHGGTEWAEFTIPVERWNPAGGAKRQGRPMTVVEKQAARARLLARRAA